MDRAFDVVAQIPPNTLVWMGLICCLSFATTNRIVAPAKLVFLPGKLKREPWRVLTLFVYLGDFLVFVLQKLFQISRCLASFESGYFLRPDIIPRPLLRKLSPAMKEQLDLVMQANRTIDYSYFLFSVGLTIVAVIRAVEAATSLQFLVLGPILEQVIHYISCRVSPYEDFFYYGIRMPARYSPWVLAGLEILFTNEYHIMFKELVYARDLSAVGRFLASSEVLSVVVAIGVGHLWWFLRFFLMSEVYGGWRDVFDESAGVWPMDLGRVALQYLLTPPWYYYSIFHLLRAEAENRPLAVLNAAEPQIQPQHLSHTIPQAQPLPHTIPQAQLQPETLPQTPRFPDSPVDLGPRDQTPDAAQQTAGHPGSDQTDQIDLIGPGSEAPSDTLRHRSSAM